MYKSVIRPIINVRCNKKTDNRNVRNYGFKKNSERPYKTGNEMRMLKKDDNAYWKPESQEKKRIQ